MKLEQPKVQHSGDLAPRVQYLEHYLFRLVQQLQAALNQLEKGGEP